MGVLDRLRSLFSKKEGKSKESRLSSISWSKPKHSCYYCKNFLLNTRQCHLKKFIGSIELSEAQKINQCDAWVEVSK
ncbi:MAG TPA: hypothetical protein VNM22_07250 [Candidatus Limnocylindrales bacterium]|nr:hypothetical protein [Candidatus Limnocylindrales bacterium]